MAKRNYIFDTIKDVYKLYGFKQIETPAMENLYPHGKVWWWGWQITFKILNSGDFLKSMDAEDITENNLLLLQIKYLIKDYVTTLLFLLHAMLWCTAMK